MNKETWSNCVKNPHECKDSTLMGLLHTSNLQMKILSLIGLKCCKKQPLLLEKSLWLPYNITNLQWAYVTMALRQRDTDRVTNIGNAMLLQKLFQLIADGPTCNYGSWIAHVTHPICVSKFHILSIISWNPSAPPNLFFGSRNIIYGFTDCASYLPPQLECWCQDISLKSCFPTWLNILYIFTRRKKQSIHENRRSMIDIAKRAFTKNTLEGENPWLKRKVDTLNIVYLNGTSYNTKKHLKI